MKDNFGFQAEFTSQKKNIKSLRKSKYMWEKEEKEMFAQEEKREKFVG